MLALMSVWLDFLLRGVEAGVAEDLVKYVDGRWGIDRALVLYYVVAPKDTCPAAVYFEARLLFDDEYVYPQRLLGQVLFLLEREPVVLLILPEVVSKGYKSRRVERCGRLALWLLGLGGINGFFGHGNCTFRDNAIARSYCDILCKTEKCRDSPSEVIANRDGRSCSPQNWGAAVFNREIRRHLLILTAGTVAPFSAKREKNLPKINQEKTAILPAVSII